MNYPTRSDIFYMNSVIDYTNLIKLQSEAIVSKKKVKTLNVPRRMDVKNNDKRK